MKENAFGVGDGINIEALGIMDSDREIDVGDRIGGKCVQELERSGGEVRDKFLVGRSMGQCSTEAGGKFIGKEGVRFDEGAPL